MKKYFYGLLTLALCAGLMFSVYGCGGGSGAGGPLGGGTTVTSNPDAPALGSIVDIDGDDLSSDNNEEEIFFRAKGNNFGITQGDVTFTNVSDNSVINATILTWADTQVVGQITIPAGKYLITVVTDSSGSTTDQIFYLKGTGSFPVTAQ